jgi:hypothetical protein
MNSQLLIYEQLPEALKMNFVKIDVTTLMIWSCVEVVLYWASTYTSQREICQLFIEIFFAKSQDK